MIRVIEDMDGEGRFDLRIEEGERMSKGRCD